MTAALIATALAVGGWWAIRWERESLRIDHLAALLLTLPEEDR